ncbi:hypothetical protein [Streptomyces sp. NPDC002088]|uniref:hypothetical protein n=1 Tax=Streptomyces sp. NPDC002088 TaxID=3154665 RepID=UPI00331D6189
MRTSTRIIVTACALTAALLVAGCGGGEEPAHTTAPQLITGITLDHSAHPGKSNTDTTSLNGTTATEEPMADDLESLSDEIGEFLSDEIGPDLVPEIPDLPDGGGLIPDDTDETDRTDGSETIGSIFDSPTDLFVD